jgi:cell division protein ZapA
MAEVTITLNGRSYRLECDDGEKERLLSLSEMVGHRLAAHQQKFGHVGDDRLLLMTALTIADELSETKEKLANYEEAKLSADNIVQSAEARMVDQISAAAERIEVLSMALADHASSGKDNK